MLRELSRIKQLRLITGYLISEFGAFEKTLHGAVNFLSQNLKLNFLMFNFSLYFDLNFCILNSLSIYKIL